jgi:hypothetical protein
MLEDVMSQLMGRSEMLQARRSVSADVYLACRTIRDVEALQGFHFHEAQLNALPHDQFINVAGCVKRQTVPQAVFERGFGGLAEGRLRLGAH